MGDPDGYPSAVASSRHKDGTDDQDGDDDVHRRNATPGSTIGQPGDNHRRRSAQAAKSVNSIASATSARFRASISRRSTTPPTASPGSEVKAGIGRERPIGEEGGKALGRLADAADGDTQSDRGGRARQVGVAYRTKIKFYVAVVIRREGRAMGPR